MRARELTAALRGSWHGRYGTARCPAHDDRTPSLTIRDGDDSILLCCHAGCDRAAIIAALKAQGLWGGRDTAQAILWQPPTNLSPRISSLSTYRSISCKLVGGSRQVDACLIWILAGCVYARAREEH
jgi:hypothetical protein